MAVIHASDHAPQTVAPGRSRYLAHTEQLMMVVIDFEDGPAVEPDPPHSHPHEQVTYVVDGEVIFYLDGQPNHLFPGDMVSVPADLPHSIQTMTSRVRLIDTFTPLRKDFLA